MDLCPDSALNLLKGIPEPEKLWGRVTGDLCSSDDAGNG